MCGGVVGDGLVGVHDSPGLVTVCNLSCHPSMEELGGWGIGRGVCRGRRFAWGGVCLWGWEQ